MMKTTNTLKTIRVNKSVFRGFPKIDDVVLLNEKCIGRVDNIDWDAGRVTILKGQLEPNELVTLVIILDEETIEKMRVSRPHLLI